MNLRYTLPPGFELRVMRGHEPINPNQVSVTIHRPGEGNRGRVLCAMASALVSSTSTVEQTAQRLVNQCSREAGIDG